MFDLDHWQEIWTALSRNRLRTFLTAFGVFWGIFLLVLLLGAGNGLRNGINSGFAGTATNSFFCWGMRTSKPFAGLPAGRAIEFTNEDTASIRHEVPEAKVVAPRRRRGGGRGGGPGAMVGAPGLPLGGWRGGATVVRGVNTGAYSIMGDMPEILTIQSLAVSRGRFINAIDVAEKRKVAVLGIRPYEVLFEKGEDPVGQAIKINGIQFEVIGTFRSRQSGGNQERDAETIFIPFTTFQQSFNAINEVHWYAVT